MNCLIRLMTFIGFALACAHLRAHEIGERSRLAVGILFGYGREGGDAIFLLSKGNEGAAFGVEGERGKRVLGISLRKGVQDESRRRIVAFLLGADPNPVVGLDGLRRSRILRLDHVICGDGIVPFSGVLMDAGDACLGDRRDLGRRILCQVILKSLKRIGKIAKTCFRAGLLDDGEAGESAVRVDGERFIEIANRLVWIVQLRYILPRATGRLSARASPLYFAWNSS